MQKVFQRKLGFFFFPNFWVTRTGCWQKIFLSYLIHSKTPKNPNQSAYMLCGKWCYEDTRASNSTNWIDLEMKETPWYWKLIKKKSGIVPRACGSVPLNETLMIDEQSPCHAYKGMLDDFINTGSAETSIWWTF